MHNTTKINCKNDWHHRSRPIYLHINIRRDGSTSASAVLGDKYFQFNQPSCQPGANIICRALAIAVHFSIVLLGKEREGELSEFFWGVPKPMIYYTIFPSR
jgi:hypothetical protein